MSRVSLSWKLWLAALALLLLPAIAMLMTDEVKWGLEDFAIFGAMLIFACGLYEVASDLIKRPALRAIAVAAIAASFVLVWAELAVGLFR